MATRRERMEARAERRLEWAQSREQKAEQAFKASHDAVDGIPMGQPILRGHHSERAHRRAVERAQSKAWQSVDHSRMAEHHKDRAKGIERQLANTIYSDDHDALERLDEKIAKLEAEREQIKAFNKKAKAAGEPIAPSYMLTNLGANIRRCKQRRDEIAARNG